MIKITRFLLLFLCSLLYVSCIGWEGDNDPVPQSSYSPVVLEREAFENSVQLLPPRSIEKSGKIYVKDDLLFINEVNKGFHIFNYTTPENPVPLSFLQILGATDLAIRDNVLYINQAVDLVSINYNLTQNTMAVSYRNENVFPQKLSPDGMYATIENDEIIIDWTEQ